MSAAQSRPEPTPAGSSIEDEHALLDDLGLRDALTRTRLADAGAHLAGLEVVGYEPSWWDGQAHTPCLVVRGGRRDRLQRIVETGGECVIVPFDRRGAERRLADRRRAARPELTVPAPRPPADLVLDATTDVVRCGGETCGALLPIGAASACPVCGLWP